MKTVPDWVLRVRRSAGKQVGAQPELLVSVLLVVATMLLILNGTAIYARAQLAGSLDVRLAMVMLTLNVALIIAGLRRLADLQRDREKVEEAKRRTASLVSTDQVTGLANRKGLADQGQALKDSLIKEGRWLSVVSIQLHKLKSINERHGHDMVDSLLREIGMALTNIVPARAVVARPNGDEFAVAFGMDANASDWAERTATEILRRMTAPFEIDGKMLQVGAYAGIACLDAQEAALPDLLRRADIALERARSARAARPTWFDEGMEKALIAHVEVEQGVRDALQNEQFVPYFEPQVDLSTGEIVGLEVLARWDHPLSGLIMPETFIPIAEENGLIGKLSEQVFAKALSYASNWPGNFSLSINISPTQLADPWFAQKVVRLLTTANFPAERLVIEVTESSLLADVELAKSIITSLKNHGIRVALDDFGTGFSSLAHIRALPFDMIKIDRSFTEAVSKDAESAAIIRAVTDLATAIGVPVTIEGIEDEETHSVVLGFGCAFGQGWYFGKPMTSSQTERVLQRRQQSGAGEELERKAG